MKTQVLKKQLKGKLLFFDIETSPMSVYTFMIGRKVSISHSQVITHSKVITIAYMFEGDKSPVVMSWNPKTQDDSKLIESFVKIANKADVLIAQNGDQFDMGVLRWRINLLNLTPLHNVTTIDTLKLSRKSFFAPSHKLDFRSQSYGLGGKVRMELRDWIDVLNKVPGSLEKMMKYNAKDVVDLRSLFWKELPYYKSLPVNLGLLTSDKESKIMTEECTNCRSKRISKNGYRFTQNRRRQRYNCHDCGSSFTK